MNILVVSDHGLYTDLTSSFVHNQAMTFAALGHRVRVLLPFPVGKSLNGRRMLPIVTRKDAEGVEIYYFRFLSLSNLGRRGFNTDSAKLALKLVANQVLEGFTPDVIHAHTFGLVSQLGIILKHRLRCPLVITTHGSDTNVALRNGAAARLCSSADQADMVTAVSPILAQRLATCGTKTPIKPIINGFMLRNIPDGLERDPYAMIQVGNLVPSKRVDVTIRAFAQLKKWYPQMSLCIIGKGPEAEHLKALCTDLGVENSVRFLGWLPNQEVFLRMCQATFFVMASKPEGFGIVYLEAMAAGCVTVGTQGEGIDGFIRHGENGFLVPADDANAIVQVIDSCFQHPQEISAIAQMGQQEARKQTWEHNAKQYSDLFSSILSPQTGE